MNKKLDNILTKKWENLTIEDKKYLRNIGVLNGYGGASQSWLARFFIGLILEDFSEAIPDKHDFGYSKGIIGILSKKFIQKMKKNNPQGLRILEEERRLECDEKFYQAMLDDIRERYDWGDIGKWERVWKSIVALLAYNAIRLRGNKYFFYS